MRACWGVLGVVVCLTRVVIVGSVPIPFSDIQTTESSSEITFRLRLEERVALALDGTALENWNSDELKNALNFASAGDYPALFLATPDDEIITSYTAHVAYFELVVTFKSGVVSITSIDWRFFFNTKRWTFDTKLFTIPRFSRVRWDKTLMPLASKVLASDCPGFESDITPGRQDLGEPGNYTNNNATSHHAVFDYGIQDNPKLLITSHVVDPHFEIEIQSVLSPGGPYHSLELENPLLVRLSRSEPIITVDATPIGTKIYDSWEETYGGIGPAPSPEGTPGPATRSQVDLHLLGAREGSLFLEADPEIPGLQTSAEELESRAYGVYKFYRELNPTPGTVPDVEFRWDGASWTLILGDDGGRTCHQCDVRSWVCPSCTWVISTPRWNQTNPRHVYSLVLGDRRQRSNVTVTHDNQDVTFDYDADTTFDKKFPSRKQSVTSSRVSLYPTTLLDPVWNDDNWGTYRLGFKGLLALIRESDLKSHSPIPVGFVDTYRGGFGCGSLKSHTYASIRELDCGLNIAECLDFHEYRTLPFPGGQTERSVITFARNATALQFVLPILPISFDISVTNVHSLRWREPYLAQPQAKWQLGVTPPTADITKVMLSSSSTQVTFLTTLVNHGTADGKVELRVQCSNGVILQPRSVRVVAPQGGRTPYISQHVEHGPHLQNGDAWCNFTATVLSVPVWTNVGKEVHWNVNLKISTGRFGLPCTSQAFARIKTSSSTPTVPASNNTNPTTHPNDKGSVMVPGTHNAITVSGNLNTTFDITSARQVEMGVTLVNDGTRTGSLTVGVVCQDPTVTVAGFTLPNEELTAGEMYELVVTFHQREEAQQLTTGVNNTTLPSTCVIRASIIDTDECSSRHTVVEAVQIDFVRLATVLRVDATTTPTPSTSRGNSSQGDDTGSSEPHQEQVGVGRVGRGTSSPPMTVERILIITGSIVVVVMVLIAVVLLIVVRRRNASQRSRHYEMESVRSSLVHSAAHDPWHPQNVIDESRDLWTSWNQLTGREEPYRILTDFRILNQFHPRPVSLGSFEMATGAVRIVGRLSRPGTGDESDVSETVISLQGIKKIFWDQPHLWLQTDISLYLLAEPSEMYATTFKETLETLRAGRPAGISTEGLVTAPGASSVNNSTSAISVTVASTQQDNTTSS